MTDFIMNGMVNGSRSSMMVFLNLCLMFLILSIVLIVKCAITINECDKELDENDEYSIRYLIRYCRNKKKED